MTIKDLLAIIEIEDDSSLCYEVITKDGRTLELESINGSYYENLSDHPYWVDSDYESETLEDGEDELTAFTVLLDFDGLMALEVVKLEIGTYFTTIRARA